jgi:hypothetical protein
VRALAIFVGLWAGLALSTIDRPSAEAKGLRALQYIVKEGDTIYDLARRFGCTVADLERSNQLGEVLPVGKKLSIPSCGKRDAAAEARLEPHAKRAAKPPQLGKTSRTANRLQQATAKRSVEAPRDERTASRLVEPPRRAPSKAAIRSLPPAHLHTAHPPEPAAASVAVARSKSGLGAVSGSAGSIAGSSPRSLSDAGAGALAAALASPGPESSQELGASVDPVTGSITRPTDAALDAGLDLTHEAGEDPASLPLAHKPDHKLALDGRVAPAQRRPNDAASLLDPDPTTDPTGEPLGQSIGHPWRGRLQSAARLGYGEGYILRRPNRTYGTRTTVAHVEHALAELRQKFPRLHTLAVGDLSLPSGGPVSEHRSHQSGRDIDLGLCYHTRPRGYPEHFVVATEATLNAAATWALISALDDTADLDGGIEMIFLDFQVQGMIYRWALAEGIDHERLERIFQFPHGRGSGVGLVRHAPNHADHLHARFRCAADETGCR